MIPTFLKFSTTSILGISSLFFISLTILSYTIFKKYQKKELFYLFILSFSYTAYIRPENIFLIIIFIIDILQEKIFTKEKILPIIILIITLIPSILLIFYGSFILNLPGWNETPFKLTKNIVSQIITNIFFFINPLIFPIPLTVLAFLGIKIKSKEKKFFIKTFFIFFFIYTTYHIGKFQAGGTRYTLILFIPIIYFASIKLKTILKNKNANRLILIIVILYLISLIPTINYIIKPNPFQEYKKDLLSLNISKDAYILSYNSSLIITTINQNTLRPAIFIKNQEYFKDKEIYLLKEYFWKNEIYTKTNKKITNNYHLKQIKNSSIYLLN